MSTELNAIDQAVARGTPSAAPAHPGPVPEVPQPRAAGPASEQFAPAEPAAPPPSVVQEPPYVPEIVQPPEPERTSDFDVTRLTTEEQELHRRANRVAKVSMQD